MSTYTILPDKISCGIIIESSATNNLIQTFIKKSDELELLWTINYMEESFPFLENNVPHIFFFNILNTTTDIPSLVRPIFAYHPGIIITSVYSVDELGSIPFHYVDILREPISLEDFKRSIKRYKILMDKGFYGPVLWHE